MAALVTELDDQLADALDGAGRDPARAIDALQRAVTACRTNPQVAAEFDLPGLLDELAELYAQVGRTEDALATMRAAIAAGYTSTPDPRCRLAEIQLRAGRAEPAHALFAQVLADTPGDVWLYNNAGLEYAAAGDHLRALGWLTPGLALALDSGDPERLVGQLSELRATSRAALGQSPDELDERAERFLAHPRPAPAGWSSAALPALTELLNTLPETELAPTALAPAGPPTGAPRVALAVAWFPPGELPAALSTWPQLASDWDTTDQAGYNHRLEQHLRRLAATTTGPIWIAPIHIDAFRTWCTTQHRDPATSDARAGYAADQARTRAPGLIAWPPQRNQPCWCTSGRKYKKCCAHPAALAATADAR